MEIPSSHYSNADNLGTLAIEKQWMNVLASRLTTIESLDALDWMVGLYSWTDFN